MERLTKRLPGGAADYNYPKSCYFGDGSGADRIAQSAFRQRCVEQLAEYEDTGLTPEEIDMDHEAADQLRNLCQGCDLDRLEKLAEADRAGRLVVRPCKTRQKELLEQYPTADVDESGVLEVCPALLFASHRGKKGGCSTPNRSCDDCRKEFWGLWAEAALEAKKDE